MFSKLFTLAALATAASAHFTLDYPLARGFDEDIEGQFCGGFNDTMSPRASFPIGAGAPVLIDSHHASADVAILISFASDPTSFANFSSLLMDFGTITGQGEFCFNVDVDALNVAGVTNGSVATIQVEFVSASSCRPRYLQTADRLYTERRRRHPLPVL